MSRLEAFGNQLVEFHLWLRYELDDLRGEVAAVLTEGRPFRRTSSG